ncbi:MAG: thioredoxin reductase, partial [Clostridium sp.]
MRQELIDNIPSESPLVSEELKNQLKTIFDKLDKPLKLVTILEVGDDSCIEMGAFLKAIAPLNENLELKFLEKGEEPDIDEELNAYMLPVVGLFRGDEYLGAAFHGVPGGQEINSFALAIYHAAGPAQDVDEKTLKKIQKLKKKNNIKVCISLSCHHCPLVVSAGQSIALLSPNVVCEMVD